MGYAEKVLGHFYKSTMLILASNGLTKVQRSRLGALSAYFRDIIVSEEAGVIKPGERFWNYALGRAGCAAEKCLMVGDSLKNDILGAAACGMDTCWMNRKRKKRESDVAPTYEIYELKDMLGL